MPRPGKKRPREAAERGRQALSDRPLPGKACQAHWCLRSTIYKDLALLHKRWREEAVTAIDQLKHIELRRLAHLERTAWRAFKKSQRERTRNSVEKITGKSPGTKTKISKEAQSGNPAFLERIAWCINKRCQILGLDSPYRVAPIEITDKKKDIAALESLSTEELRILANIYQRGSTVCRRSRRPGACHRKA